MATLTIRNVPPQTVRSLKSRAKRHGNSMEQEVREILDSSVVDRRTVLAEIAELRKTQRRRVSAAEIDRWIEEGRP